MLFTASRYLVWIKLYNFLKLELYIRKKLFEIDQNCIQGQFQSPLYFVPLTSQQIYIYDSPDTLYSLFTYIQMRYACGMDQILDMFCIIVDFARLISTPSFTLSLYYKVI